MQPLFDDVYLRTLYGSGRRDTRELLEYYVRRFHTLRNADDYDLIWIEKEVFPFVPGHLERWSIPHGIPYVVDYDDATFHRYDQHRSGLIRSLFAKKLYPLLASASAVTAGNPYLADYAKRAGASSVEIVPTVVDIDRYQCVPVAGDDELRIGWIGSPSTTRYLELLKQPLEKLSREVPIRLVTIGAADLPKIRVPDEQHPWSEETEATLLSTCHVGVMPLADEAWERGKCGYKLIQYMACALPVVASPVGVNRDIVTDRVGFLAESAEQWLDALQQIARDAALRRQLGQAGRLAVEARYSLQAQAPRLIELLLRASGR